MTKHSFRAFAALALVGSTSILSLAAAPAKADLGFNNWPTDNIFSATPQQRSNPQFRPWVDNFAEWSYGQFRNRVGSPTEVLYPHPRTYQATPWQPSWPYNRGNLSAPRG